MRLIHFVQFGPRSCGLYETAKDLILAERRLGIDAHLVDVDDAGQSRVGLADGSIVTAHPDLALDADVLIRHSSIPSKYQNLGIPVVMCLHGRPESTYRISSSSQNNIIHAVANKAKDSRYKAFVTFWPQYVTAWRALVSDKLCLVPAPVDLEYYAGGKDQKFEGSHKILIADIWRDDVIPLSSLFGAARYIEQYEPQARIHLVGLPHTGPRYEALKPILAGLKDKIGSCCGQMQNIRDWYASCDVVVTPHSIATRIIRESLAAGLPVVAGAGCNHTIYKADPSDPDEVALAIHRALSDPAARQEARSTALDDFNSLSSAKAMAEICQAVAARQDRSVRARKVFLDIGGHLGETVRRFYRERPDAADFEIYTFEPDPMVFDRMFATVGAMRNVNCINAALGTADTRLALARGAVNDGEGSTLMAGKLTGALGQSVDVQCLDMARFIRALGPIEYLIVKMNIEGAEYDLLPYMLTTGIMTQVHELYVQLHSLKFDTAHRIEMDQIELSWLEAMKQYTTKVFAQQKGMASFGNP